MALTDENTGMVMPVAPAYGGNGGFGGFGGDGAWLILFILFAMGGWGNGYGNGFGGNQLSYDFPWLLNGQNGINDNINGGFRDAMLNDGINAIQSGINGISTQLCNGFAGVEQGANTRQMANMQTAFANQTAMAQGFSDVASQLASCCCENRLATAQTQALVQSENCADRQALSDGIRDIIANQTQGFQNILSQMCSDKLDAKNEKIAELQTQLQMAQLQATQNEQTAQIEAGQRNLVNEVEGFIKPPINPAYIVPNPYASYSTGCGCGCGV